ncbi:MAG TPA: hypothetical protein VGV35_11510 [Bryobacteraceae bacterium]|nr:hypothetical protein [Bryobacteraceae bacterium]
MKPSLAGWLGCTLTSIGWLSASLDAQQPSSEPKVTMQEAWDSVLPNAPPQVRDASPLTPPQIGAAQGMAADFLNHFFFESRTEYWRYSSSFTGLPTVTGVINAPFTGIFNPNGIPYPPVFQPDANRLYSFLDWGTRGWLSDRVNTHFSFSYRQDVTHVQPGAAAENLIETFDGNRSLQLLSASVQIGGRPTDGVWAGTSLQLGRQYVYGAEFAAIDGASFSIDRPRFSLTVFGGRRFSLFADPDQRALGGANLVFKLSNNSSLEYDTLWYIRGTNSLAYRRRLGSSWLLHAYFRMFGGSPVDFSTQGIYSSRDGRTSVRLNFFQKLTDKDYSYDYTIAARDLDPHNALAGLYLGPLSPYSQFAIDARRSIASRLRLGGAVWIRRLNDAKDQGPFDTSFQDYRADAQIFPFRKVATFFGYHQRDSDRLSPVNATTFDDISRTGETSVKDLTGEVRRAFGEGRFGVSGGAYYRRISFQDRFFVLNGLHQSGWLSGAWWRVDARTRVYGDYNLDNDFFLFRPDLKNSRMLRVGVSWKY